MPMAEGGAIAQIVTMLHWIGCRDYHLVPQEGFDDDANLTISVGGPSVNAVSANILQTYFPAFRIEYPGHVASYGTMTFDSAKAADGTLREDYGFIASVTGQSGRRYVVLCGVWAMGTQIATDALLNLPRDSEVSNDLRHDRNVFAVTHGTVTGLSHGHAEVVGVHHV